MVDSVSPHVSVDMAFGEDDQNLSCALKSMFDDLQPRVLELQRQPLSDKVAQLPILREELDQWVQAASPVLSDSQKLIIEMQKIHFFVTASGKVSKDLCDRIEVISHILASDFLNKSKYQQSLLKKKLTVMKALLNIDSANIKFFDFPHKSFVKFVVKYVRENGTELDALNPKMRALVEAELEFGDQPTSGATSPYDAVSSVVTTVSELTQSAYDTIFPSQTIGSAEDGEKD